MTVMRPPINLLIAGEIAGSALPEAFQYPKSDIRHFIFPQIGIDEVREITRVSANKSLSDGDYVFVILTSSITVEAQNAFLKLFEEPPQNTIFYLIIPAESILLPTLRSRFIDADNQHIPVDTKIAQDFMDLDYANRLEMIADKAKKKDLIWMEAVVGGLGHIDKTASLSPAFKKSLLLCESYFRIRGAGRKMLLEEIALSLPVS